MNDPNEKSARLVGYLYRLPWVVLASYCGWALTQRWEGATLAFIVTGWLSDIAGFQRK